MKKSKLSSEEQALLNSYERGEWQSTRPSASELRKFQKAARASLAKDTRINIRLPSRVLEDIRLKALDEGIPYQTLISSILFKFASGRLVDKAHNNSSEKDFTPRIKKVD